MKKEEIKKSINELKEQARLAESLLNSEGWQKLFEPLLNRKIEYYKNPANFEDDEKVGNLKKIIEILESLKTDIQDCIDQVQEIEKIEEKLDKE